MEAFCKGFFHDLSAVSDGTSGKGTIEIRPIHDSEGDAPPTVRLVRRSQ